MLPLWFDGPGWWTAPLALAGGWSSGERRTDWITPLYHRSSVAGATSSMHLLTYIATQDGVCAGKAITPKVRATVSYVKRGGKWLEAFYMVKPVE